MFLFCFFNIEISGKNGVKTEQPLPAPTLVSEVKELTGMKGMSYDRFTICIMLAAFQILLLLCKGM